MTGVHLFGTAAATVLAAVSAFRLAAAEPSPLAQAAWFKTDISPKLGAPVAGYGANDVSVEQVDPLYATGLLLEYRGRRVLLVSLDLLGIDAPVLREFRQGIGKILETDAANVMLTCTHTHGGPHSRMLNEGEVKMKLDFSLDRDPPPGMDVAYLKELRSRLYASARQVMAAPRRDVKIGFYSLAVDQNSNRRFTTADNHASFVAHRRILQQIGTGIADKEFGTVALLDPKSLAPLYVIGNYSAHPLAAHGPGTGGLRISADFPGYFRRYVRRETGAEAMFVQGACGDTIPKGDELGANAARRVGEALAEAAMASIIDIQRNPARFVFAEPRLEGRIGSMETKLLKRQRDHFDGDRTKLEIQCLSIGDLAWVGVPGEILNELGLEIKWHSPFQRTFIAYSATDYFGYISQRNFVAAGGYEPQSQRFPSRDTLKLLCLAADTLSDTRAAAFPEDYRDEDPYPDQLELPLVNLPGGVKHSKKNAVPEPAAK